VVDFGPFDNNRNDVPGGQRFRAQLAGVFFSEETRRIEAFHEESGKRTVLGTLGGSFSIARDINNHSEIVGGSLTERGENFTAFSTVKSDCTTSTSSFDRAAAGRSSRHSPLTTEGK
jgi:uncharacterized membrane protein